MKISYWLAGILTVLTASGQTGYTFSDGGKRAAYWLSGSEIFSRGDAMPTASSVAEWGGGTVYTLPSADALVALRNGSSADRELTSPVFYYQGDLPTPEKLAAMLETDRARRMESARRLMTAKLLVHMDASRFPELAATQPADRENSLLNGWMLILYADPFAALDAADWMNKQGNWEFIPVFSRMMEKRQVLTRPVNDPLYVKQWHLAGSGFNLNMKNAWDQVTGRGINMAVVDDGLEIKHEDLASNAYPLESGYHFNFNDGLPADPSPLKASESHGTSCAGLAGAAGFNNIGVVGVAPEVRLMGLRLLAGATADDASATALAWQPNGIVTHVSSNSWGPPDDGKSDGRVSALQLAGIEKGATTNRGGLGTIYAISCGNGRSAGDDSGYDGFSGSRFGIAVAAVNHEGGQNSDSESGMNVAISALGGEFEAPEGMWTTNNSGVPAFQLKAEKHPTSQAPINYTDVFIGTSAAAAQVSGATALLLEKNPKLGYRDVKEILMKTAIRDGLVGDDDFTENGGGFYFSHAFGSGLLNVSGALDLASNWSNLGALVTAEASNSQGGSIPDTRQTVTRKFDFSNARMRVEHVELTVTVTHANRGDLAFVIASPSGMQSIASPRVLDDGADFTDYTFTSVRHWGESAAGVWRFGVVDSTPNGVAGQLVSVKLKLYGTAQKVMRVPRRPAI